MIEDQQLVEIEIQSFQFITHKNTLYTDTGKLWAILHFKPMNNSDLMFDLFHWKRNQKLIHEITHVMIHKREDFEMNAD